MRPRVYLSPPHLTGRERVYVDEAFASNWVAPLGPNVDRFESEFAARVGAQHAAALSSGTAGLHLALLLLGVRPDEEVVVSSLTFVASVNPIRYVNARPVLIDSERESWNVDPGLMAEAIKDRIKRTDRPPAAVILVHLYGQSANVDPVVELCRHHEIPLIEDAAEALGSTYNGRSPGTFGRIGVFSFNGNKIITTSGGGMIVSEDEALIQHARKLSTQARDPAPWYEHTEIGFNYRMSNICAGIGRGQLETLDARIEARRSNFECYRSMLGQLPGVEFQPEARWGLHTRWLTCMLLGPESGAAPEQVRTALEAENIEARPLWKPMHLQPLYKDCPMYGGAVAADLFARGLCLPSGSNLAPEDRERVVEIVRRALRQG